MKYIKTFEIYSQSNTDDPNIKIVYVNSNAKNTLDIDVSDDPELRYFFEWLDICYLRLEVNYPHHFSRDPKFAWGVKIHSTCVKDSCTWTQYTIGEGDVLEDAIHQYIDKIKGETLIQDSSRGPSPAFYGSKEIKVPEDFELFMTSKKYNL